MSARRPAKFGAALTGSELTVLQLAASGWSSTQIGLKMYLTEDTVKTHLTRAYAKLGARGRSHAVALGIKLELVDVEQVVDTHEADRN